MVYRNQNYMTNPLLKEQADKAQKDYVEPEFTPVTYSFASYSDNKKTTKWGEGTVETTNVTSNGFTKVKILTNSTDQSFVNQFVYIKSDAKTDGTVYPLYSDAGKTPLNIYVTIDTVTDIFVPVKYSFISYDDAQKTTKWAEGTVETTNVTSNGFTKVKVLTNTVEDFVGQFFYITSDAKTDGTVYQLYSDAGETALDPAIYVTINTIE